MGYTMEMSNSTSGILQQIAIASIPTIAGLLTAWVIFFARVEALSVKLDSVSDRSTRYHNNVREAILNHGNVAAHGTVREDLGKLDLRVKGLEHRAEMLESIAKEGERWTEDDAKRDFDHLMVMINEQRLIIRELRTRIRVLEQEKVSNSTVKLIPNQE